MKPTVVVVDDEPAIVEVVCDALEDVDVTTVGCVHGPEAHACIRRVQPKLVILDVQMPGVDGVEVFRTMRADPAMRGIPVIFFTANAEKLKQRLPEYEGLGAALLPKPFNVVRLLDMVEAALADGRDPAAG
jgi:CheY-like chemotaxis protein